MRRLLCFLVNVSKNLGLFMASCLSVCDMKKGFDLWYFNYHFELLCLLIQQFELRHEKTNDVHMRK